jgi:hypothetical protein
VPLLITVGWALSRLNGTKRSVAIRRRCAAVFQTLSCLLRVNFDRDEPHPQVPPCAPKKDLPRAATCFFCDSQSSVTVSAQSPQFR